MRRFLLRVLLVSVVLCAAVPPASAVELKISAKALERTLRAQLFNSPDGRYYLRGNAHSTCYVYADSPHVSFVDDRVVVHVHTRSKIGTSVLGACVGVSLSTNADVSIVPDAYGDSNGFREAKVELLSE